MNTERLLLTPATTADLEPMAALHADERVWRHRPTGRHTDPERTRTVLLDCERQWQTDGLGYWVARLREQLGVLPSGAVAGMGGCGITPGGSWWNLYYRLAPEAQHHGLAAELSAAAIKAAQRTRPELPVVAYLLEHNVASRVTAERVGLQLAWRGPDAGIPDPEAVRLIFADRPLEQPILEAVAASS